MNNDQIWNQEIKSDQHHLFVGRNDPNRCCSLKVEIENIWKFSKENELIGRVGLLYLSIWNIYQMMNNTYKETK